MKNIVIVCLLALYTVLCTVNAIPIDDLESLRRQVREAVYTIDNNIHRLERLRVHTEEDTDRQVNDKLNEEQDSYRDYKDSFIKDIRNKLNDAKERGKDTAKLDVCYKDAMTGIDNNEKQAQEASAKCVQEAESSIKNNLGFLDNLIETGRTLISELDDIFLDCHDVDIFKKKSCIIAELSRINIEVSRLEDNIVSAEITAVPLSNNVVKQAGNCIKNAYSPVYSGSTLIKLNVEKCFNDVGTKEGLKY